MSNGSSEPLLPWWARPVLGIINILIFVAALIGAFLSKNEQIELMLVGAVVANATNVMSYYFGTSHSAEKKDG